jgi:hypothetical protein
MRPTPIQPTVMRLLGAPAPKTEEGTIAGRAKPAPTAAEVLRKSRREMVWPEDGA